MDFLSIPVALVVVVCALVYYYATRTFSYWKDRGVTFVKPVPLIGSMLSVLMQKEHTGEFFKRIADENKGAPYVGFFQGVTPGLIVMDRELIKSVMVKDFSHFVDHGFEIDEAADPLQAKNLFNMDGQKWREMRNKLSPTFTSGKIKNMFPLVEECTKIFEKFMREHQGENIDIKDLLARFTTDIIASCAFGININSIETPNDQFRVMGRKMLEADFIQGVKNACVMFLPVVARFFKFTFFKEEVSQFFRSLVKDIVARRTKTGNTRVDFMQLLIQLKEKGRLVDVDEGDDADANEPASTNNFKLNDDDIVAQALVFFIAGFETSSSALSYAMMEMARMPLVQKKARENIEKILERHDGKMNYQALQEMEYLDWIVDEALRMYPSLPLLNRTTTKNYTIPGTGVTLDKGTAIVIPIRALQNDPEFFDEPLVFNPDRFADAQKNHSNQFTYMPFGEGPRQCIGMRFAKMQSKMALYSILRNFEVLESPLTAYPPTFDPKLLLLTTKEDIFVQLKSLST